jgi:hypothetical protein
MVGEEIRRIEGLISRQQPIRGMSGRRKNAAPSAWRFLAAHALVGDRAAVAACL